MGEHSYTVAELDALREAVKNRHLYGCAYVPLGVQTSRVVNPRDLIPQVEEETRTHMLAGHLAADLIEEDKRKRSERYAPAPVFPSAGEGSPLPRGGKVPAGGVSVRAFEKPGAQVPAGAWFCDRCEFTATELKVAAAHVENSKAWVFLFTDNAADMSARPLYEMHASDHDGVYLSAAPATATFRGLLDLRSQAKREGKGCAQ